MTGLKSFVATPLGVLTLIDLFAQARGTRGLMPGPIPPVRFTLVSRRQNAGLIPLYPPIVLAPTVSGSGAYLFPDRALLIKGGPTYRITPGSYVVRIESDYYQTLETEISWPPTPANTAILNLNPGFAYPFPDLTLSTTGLTLLRGALLRPVMGSPIAGATVRLTVPANQGPFATAISDSTGSWVLAFPAQTGTINATVRFILPAGGGDVDVDQIPIKHGADNSLSQTALRGVVLSTSGAPIENAVITVDAQGGSVRSGRDGKWTFYLSLLQPNGAARVTATAPNGSSAFQDVQIINRKTVVVPVIQIV